MYSLVAAAITEQSVPSVLSKTVKRTSKAGTKLVHLCEECTYETANLRLINKHLLKHAGGEKAYVCPMDDCEFATSNSWSFFDHTRRCSTKDRYIRTITGEKRYACKAAGCTYTALHRSKLARHKENKHAVLFRTEREIAAESEEVELLSERDEIEAAIPIPMTATMEANSGYCSAVTSTSSSPTVVAFSSDDILDDLLYKQYLAQMNHSDSCTEISLFDAFPAAGLQSSVFPEIFSPRPITPIEVKTFEDLLAEGEGHDASPFEVEGFHGYGGTSTGYDAQAYPHLDATDLSLMPGAQCIPSERIPGLHFNTEMGPHWEMLTCAGDASSCAFSHPRMFDFDFGMSTTPQDNWSADPKTFQHADEMVL